MFGSQNLLVTYMIRTNFSCTLETRSISCQLEIIKMEKFTSIFKIVPKLIAKGQQTIKPFIFSDVHATTYKQILSSYQI